MQLVPVNLLLTSAMKAVEYSQTKLIELSFPIENKNVVNEVDVLTADEVIKKHSGKFGSIGFVVRRPG